MEEILKIETKIKKKPLNPNSQNLIKLKFIELVIKKLKEKINIKYKDTTTLNRKVKFELRNTKVNKSTRQEIQKSNKYLYNSFNSKLNVLVYTIDKN